MKKLLIGALVGLSAATFSVAPAHAADLPTFTVSDDSVYPGQVVTITVTPGTGDADFVSGPDNMADLCGGVWGSGDTYQTNADHFSLVGQFTQDSGSYAGTGYYPAAPTLSNGLQVQWAAAGWGDFNPQAQSAPFTFDFTIPSDVSVTAQDYTLSMSCISPNFWLRDRLTIVQYPIHFVVEYDSNNSGGGSGSGSNGASHLANTGSSDELPGLLGLALFATGAVVVAKTTFMKRKTK